MEVYQGVIDCTEAVEKRIPIMFQDFFEEEEFWASRLPKSANVVVDVHIYYFAGRKCDSKTILATIEDDGKTANRSQKFPVVVGGWSIETNINDRLAKRKELSDAARSAFNKYTQGKIYWSGRVESDGKVAGQSTKRDYWSYIDMIRDGVVTPWKW